MSVIDRGALAANLWPGIYAHFGAAYADHPEEWPELYDRRTSSKAYEEFQNEWGFGFNSQKDPGAPVLFDSAGNGWTTRVQHEAYAMGFILTREAVKDDLYFDLIPKYTKWLKRSMRLSREVRAVAIYDRAFNGSFPIGDGVALCANNHPLRNGATFSNVGASAGLNETTLEAAVIDMGEWTDDRGMRIAVKPRKVILPNGMQFIAERLWGTPNRVGTNNNDINAIVRTNSYPGGWVINHYLASRTSWYIHTDVGEGLIAFDREPLDVQQGDGLDNQVMKVIAYERYSHVAYDPRAIYGVQ